MNASILVVEDNLDNMKLITWLLEDAGYSFVTANSAEDALALVTTKSFDLILMDISLPGMNGMEATQQVHAIPRLANVPIIAVTAHAASGEAEKILASGVSALVTKPIDEDELYRTIRACLGGEPCNGQSTHR